MAIEGSLPELSIEEVLQLLALGVKTGVLTIRCDRLNDEAIIHFSNGDIVFAVRRRSTRRIGQRLVRTGKLTQRELSAALEVQRGDPTRRLTEILVETGVITKDEGERQVRFQIEETIHELMAWTEGYFQFEKQAEIARQQQRVAVGVESLLMEGARRNDEWTRFEATVPRPESVPALAPAADRDAATLELNTKQWELLAEIDGEKDIHRLAADMGQSAFDVAKTVYELVNAGIFEMRDPHSRFLDEQGLDPLSPDAHYQLGVTALRAGDFKRAAKAWDTYVRLSTNGEHRDRVVTALSAMRTITRFLHGATSLES